MNDAPVLFDTVYEYAGFQAASALYGALNSLAIPLIFVLAGVGWRIFRVAEDGVIRPIVFYVLSVFVIWFLGSPASGSPDALPHQKAPRILSIFDAAADGVVFRAIRAVNSDFLTKPEEWSRLAALGAQSRIHDWEIREDMNTFIADCHGPAVFRSRATATSHWRRNPLADEGAAEYEKIFILEGYSCEKFRIDILRRTRNEIGHLDVHRNAVSMMMAYAGQPQEEVEKMYLAKLLRNESLEPGPDTDEMMRTRDSVGLFRMNSPTQRTTQMIGDIERGGYTAGFSIGRVGELVTGVFASVRQVFSDAVEAKQRHYLVTSQSPHLYGLFIMILMALFPVAGLYALLPGKWTVLLQFAKVFFAVKLWPFGWSLLTAFTEKRPLNLALADFNENGEAIEVPNLFVTVSLMYFVVPAVSFLVIQLVAHASTLPFKQAAGTPAGGNPADLAR